MVAVIDVTSWRFYGDGTESGSTALNDEGRNAVIAWDTPFQLRVKIQNNGDAGATVLPKLQYRYIKKGTGGTTSWEVGDPEADNNTQWNDLETTSLLLCRAAASSSLTDNGATTERLTGANTFVAGKIDEADGTFNSGVSVAAGEETEFVWSLKLLEADKETDQEAIQFQIVPSTSSAYPSNSTLYDSQIRNPIINPEFYWSNDFEAGTNGNAITTSEASPDGFDAISDTGSNLTYSNTSPAHGSLSMDIDKNDTAVTRVRWWDLNQANGGWIRLYVYPIANTDNTLIIMWHDGGYEGTDAMGFRIEFSTTWQVRLRDNVGILETSTGTMTANEWNRIEIYVQSEKDDGTADGTLEVRVWAGNTVVDNATSPTFTVGPYTAANTDTEWEDFEIGPREGSNPVAHLRIDDIAISNTGWIGPVTTGIALTGTTFVRTATFGTGTVTTVAATFDQDGFAFYEDGTESGSTIDGSQDTGITETTGVTKQLRVQIDTTGNTPTTQFRLQYKLDTDAASEWEDLA